MGKKRSWTEQSLRDAVASSLSIAEILRKLNLRAAGGNYRQIHQYIQEYQLDTSHLTGKLWSKGKKLGPVPQRREPLETILIQNRFFRSSHLRKRLVEEEIFEHQCSNCHLRQWFEDSIPLELEHINGDPCDNRLENLCLLCPNCHALTTTYRGKNRKR